VPCFRVFGFIARPEAPFCAGKVQVFAVESVESLLTFPIKTIQYEQTLRTIVQGIIMASSDQLKLIYLVAELYYLQGKTQLEIADELGVSRPKVSRLLSQAREEGIVHITVINPFADMKALADTLKIKLGFSGVVIVPGLGASQHQVRKRVGTAAARYLEKTLQRREILGLGWGRTLYEVATALESQTDLELTLVPLVGGLGQIVPSFQVHSLARMICEKLGGTWLPMYVPAIVEDSATYHSLLVSRDVMRIIDAWDGLSTVMVGIGVSDPGPEFQMLFADYLDEEILTKLREAGVVGDICMRFFDIEGRYIDDILQNVVSIELNHLRKIPRRIGVAGGAEKAEAIIGAARGGYINELVTDESAAHRILELMDRKPL
jgi:DNA-binding transcriptional regulator LsrR (DeoR family)